MDAAGLLASYRTRALVWQEQVLLPPALALEFLRDCVQNEIRIDGFEAFDPPAGESIRNRPAESLDLSTRDFWDYSVEELCEIAADAIRAVDGPLLFQFDL